jgi:RimJ/RimL family protein N-acetyltransferase
MPRIREYSEKDSPAIVQILAEAFSDEIARGMLPLTARQVDEFSKRPSVKVLVCESEEKAVIGFLTMAEGSVEYPAQIHLIGVKSSLRGKGIGKKLVQEGIKHAEAVGRKKVKLFTRPWNIPMRKICTDLGFVPEAYLRKDYLNEDLVLYSLFLQKSHGSSHEHVKSRST